MSMNPIDWLTWLGDKLLQAFDARTKIKILVHEAFFLNDQKHTPYYFVKVTNLSPINDITITHIWIVDHSKEIDILNPNRPLPQKLNKTDVWETWFPKSQIQDHNKVFRNVYILLSDGRKYRSRKNTEVRPFGNIAG